MFNRSALPPMTRCRLPSARRACDGARHGAGRRSRHAARPLPARRAGVARAADELGNDGGNATTARRRTGHAACSRSTSPKLGLRWDAAPQAQWFANVSREWGSWSASQQGRYLGPRPLVEDNSARAASTLLTNLRVSRKLGAQIELTLDVFNLFDRNANDIAYFYESQLPGEPAPDTGRHLHPVEPRSVRLTLQARF